MGAGLIVIAGSMLIGGAWREHRDRMEFERALVVTPVERRADDALGILRVDRLKWSVIVRPTASDPDLAIGAGWIRGTALPGSRGNAGIAGHRDTFFRALRHFRVNDEIELVTQQGTVRYSVREMKVVSPNDVTVIAADRRTSLTLVTCYPFSLVGNAPRRFIVKAYKKESTTTGRWKKLRRVRLRETS
jgi:LPXTG-site transpeptidase (sortase) family protein